MESGERGLPGVGMFPSRVLAHTPPRPRPGAFSLHNQQCATLSRVPAETSTKCCVVLLCCDHWSDECSAAQGTYFIGVVVVRILIQSAHFIWNNSIAVHYLLPYQLCSLESVAWHRTVSSTASCDTLMVMWVSGLLQWRAFFAFKWSVCVCKCVLISALYPTKDTNINITPFSWSLSVPEKYDHITECVACCLCQCIGA